jgi:hypothetical protein
VLRRKGKPTLGSARADQAFSVSQVEAGLIGPSHGGCSGGCWNGVLVQLGASVCVELLLDETKDRAVFVLVCAQVRDRARSGS